MVSATRVLSYWFNYSRVQNLTYIAGETRKYWLKINSQGVAPYACSSRARGVKPGFLDQILTAEIVRLKCLILQLVPRTVEYKIGYYKCIGNPWCTYFIHVWGTPNKNLWGISYININYSIGPQLCTRCATDAMVRVLQSGFGLRDDTGNECVSHPGYLHARFQYLEIFVCVHIFYTHSVKLYAHRFMHD
jgi:hypothetical protein